MRALWVWSLMLSLLVIGLTHGQKALQTDLQVLKFQVRDLEAELDQTYVDIGYLENKHSALVMNIVTMNDQCEFTLDLQVAASRGGWQSREVLAQLAQLHHVRKERKQWLNSAQ